MGKGDKKSKKGKLAIGSYGVRRPRPSVVAKAKAISATAKPKKEKVATAKAAKPAAAKKTTKKKSEE